MKTRHLLLTALILAICVGIAGAAAIQPRLTVKCPAGFQMDEGPTTTAFGGVSYRCTAKIPKVNCGPGMEYFTGPCAFGCREKLVIK